MPSQTMTSDNAFEYAVISDRFQGESHPQNSFYRIGLWRK